MISREVYEERDRLDIAYLKSFKMLLVLWITPLLVFALTQEFAYIFVSSFIASVYGICHNKKHCHLKGKEVL